MRWDEIPVSKDKELELTTLAKKDAKGSGVLEAQIYVQLVIEYGRSEGLDVDDPVVLG